MLVVGIATIVAIGFGLLKVAWDHTDTLAFAHRLGAAVIAFTMVTVSLFMYGPSADAAFVLAVPLGSSADFSVLAGSAVTNTGVSSFSGSVGVSPGTAITNVLPAMVQSPGTIEAGTPAADQAQSDLTIAYNDAANRTADFTTATTQLGGLSLIGGVYAAPGKAALGLTGTLTLDGGGDSNSVFIFQTNFALDTAAASTIVLINGAQECNVFWQVGTSATLGASSTFVGSILAQTAITVGAAVNFHGHALARDAALTLTTDIFTDPTCAVVAPTTTTTELPTTTTEPETTTSTEAETTTTTESATTTSTEAETTTTTEPATTTEQVTTTIAATATTTEFVSPTDASLAVSTTDPQAVSTTLSATPAAATNTASTTARAELPLTGITARIIILSALSTLLLGILTIYVSREQKL